MKSGGAVAVNRPPTFRAQVTLIREWRPQVTLIREWRHCASNEALSPLLVTYSRRPAGRVKTCRDSVREILETSAFQCN